MIEFEAWPKTARLFRESMVVTEKIDGTNAAVGVVDGLWGDESDNFMQLWVDGQAYTVYAQSRNRLITPTVLSGNKGSDNYGFAQFVYSNADALVRTLGFGLHFGEWWGQGIARNYGMGRRYFSLFNTSRWKHLDDPEIRLAIGVPDEVRVVPMLSVRQLDTQEIRFAMEFLRDKGSQAAPGFMNPEGVCVYLPAAQKTFKVTFDGDQPKGLVAA